MSRYGAKHRKRSGEQQPSEADTDGSGLAVAIGALLDGILKSIVNSQSQAPQERAEQGAAGRAREALAVATALSQGGLHV